MPSLDFGPFGEVCLEWPQPTARAFGTPPYVRFVAMPRLQGRAVALRLGSFFVWSMLDARASRWPLGLLIELRLIPGHSMRMAWLRGKGRGLRDELFPRN